MSDTSNSLFRSLPAVHELLDDPAVRGFARERVVEAVRGELDRLRNAIRTDSLPDDELQPGRIIERVLHTLHASEQPLFREVINATGIVLHTNLGRAPLSKGAVEAAQRGAGRYLNLELDLDTGKRSSRQKPIRERLTQLLGCDSATVVNNCAAATVITLRALAANREVIVSRGQLVEIGGSFRIPEIMEVSGAKLREVGTTNITRIGDYERAITPQTALLMRIHTSNYRITGFAETPSLEELVALGRKDQIPVIDDVGSGSLIDLSPWGLDGEPLVRRSLAEGADLVLFSGDKLLGGPQAGIICGKANLIERIEKDPLMRAFRLDKMTLAALEATLQLYTDSERCLEQIPILKMIATPVEQLRPRCQRLAARFQTLPELEAVTIREATSYVGGGSLPDQAIPTLVVAIRSRSISESELATRLRLQRPAVLARTQEGQLWLDFRTVFEDQEEAIFEAVRRAGQPS
jgi:L-seryl-tRNA(Ser) seleniumtransferase